MRVVFFTEDISKPLDEGVKKTAYSFVHELSKNHNVLVYNTIGESNTKKLPRIRQLRLNKLLINYQFINATLYK